MSQYRVARSLPFSAEQLFDLAADVERYPSFLPLWVAARVTRRAPQAYWTDQVLRLGIVRQRFSTKTILTRPHRIDVRSDDRPFRYFRLSWDFEPAGPAACRVELKTEVEFRSHLRQRVFDLTLADSLTAVIDAFEKRATALYGDSSKGGVELAVGTGFDTNQQR